MSTRFSRIWTCYLILWHLLKWQNLSGLHHWCFPGYYTNFLKLQKQPPEVKNTCNFIKKRLQHRCFPVNIANLFRIPILKNICEWLLLKQLPILKNTSEQLLLTLLLNSKNLLTSYEQLSYYQFNVKQIKTYELLFYNEKINWC